MATRSEVKERQRSFFDSKGPPKHCDENLFVRLDGEELLAFEQADGNELEAKMMAPHSSSALCVNFFRYWKLHGRIEFLEVFAAAVFGRRVEASADSSMRFESKHRFGGAPERRLVRGKPGNVDLDVRLGRTHAILVESKFTEVFTEKPSRSISEVNTRRYARALEACVECDPLKILSAGPEFRYYQLAQRLLYTVDNEDPGFRTIPERRMLFLYFDYEDFQEELRRFPEVVRPVFREAVSVLSYQDLFDTLSRALDGPTHRAWFDYMRSRYF
jgi:hypothetical protein